MLVSLSFAVAGNSYIAVKVPSSFFVTLALCPFMVTVTESVNS